MPLFAELRLADLIDILIVASLIWFVIVWFRTSQARLALMGLAALGVLFGLARGLDLQLTSSLLQGFFAVLAVMLVVVFQDDLRRLTARGLAGMGFEVRAFQSVDACRTGCASLEQPPDLFVTDVLLGDGNGLDLAESMAAEGLLKRVVIITGHADLERIDDLLARFGWRLLMKPFTMRQLQLVVGQLMQHA